jgi:iron complex outermembrane receptor protein
VQTQRLLGFSGVLSIFLASLIPGTIPTAHAAAMEEIIITARKREENLQEVPLAIQVLDERKIERYDASNLSEIAQMANNVRIAGGTNGAGGSFIIRGMGSNAGDSGISSSVATNIDGITSERGFIARTSFFDVESVQILKGPQALFYGKNSAAGVVGVTTANPTDEFEAMIQGGYEVEAHERIIETVFSGPITDTWGYRLAFRANDMDGWIENNAQFQENSNGEVVPFALVAGFWPADESYYDLPGGRDIGKINSQSARFTLQWDPTDTFRARLKLFMTDEESNGLVGGEMASCTNPPVAAVLPIARPVLVDPFQDCKLDYETSQGDVPLEVARGWNNNQNGQLGDHLFSDYEAQIYTLDLNWDLDWGSIQSITGWLAYDFEGWDNFGGLEYPFFIGYNPDDHEQYSEEIRLSTEFDSSLNYMIGAYYESFERTHENSSKLGLFGIDPVTGFTNDQHVVQYTEGDSWSVFGQVIWDISDEYELAAGGRFTDDRKEGTQHHEYVHQFLQLIGWFPTGVDLEATTDDTDFSPEVTLTWRPRDEITVWGAWKNGYKASGYSAPTVLTNTFGPENITFGEEDADGFEIGIKSLLFDGSVRLNVTAYDFEFSDLQVSQFRPETTTFVIGNAASASTQGIEFDASWLVNENLEVYTEFGLNDAQYDDYPNVACYAFQTVAQGCIPELDDEGEPTGRSFQDLSGETLAAAPDVAGSIGFEATHTVFRDWMGLLSVEGLYTDDYSTAGNGEPLAQQDSYWNLRARLGLTSPDNKLEFALIGRNLTDEIYDEGGAKPGAITPADRGGGGSRPRSYLFQFTYRIGG